MRLFKLVSGLIVVLAFSVVAVATASAAETLWKWLPGAKGTTFTGKSGKATLRAKEQQNIECATSATSSGELLEAGDSTLSLAVVVFKGCKAANLFSVLSLGAEPEEIVSHLEIHNCLIKPKDFGLLIKPLPVHIEVPALGLLLIVEGSFVVLAEFLPTDLKHWELNVKADKKTFKQEIPSCEGGAVETLVTSVDGGAPVESSEEALEGLILFSTAQDPT